MTEHPKVSACVDCSTMIIGDLLRCGACNEHHVRRVAVRTAETLPRAMARWLVTIELLVIVTLGLIFAVRGCAS